MSSEAQKNKQTKLRDYDKEPIIIKDYGAYFQASFLMLLVPFVIFLWIGDYRDSRFEEMSFYSFDFLRLSISILFCFWFFFYLLRLPSRFQKNPSEFIFYNNFIKHIRYMYDKSEHNDEVEAPLKIQNVSFCIVAELTFRYGRLHYLTSWQLYRKSSIGVHIGKTVLYIRFLLIYFIFVLPYKIYRLKKAKESLWLLKKNLFIQFDNRNYFLVNTYSQKELNELLEYFKIHKITIGDKTVFIPQAQNDGPFKDKNEIWSNKFNNKKGVK